MPGEKKSGKNLIFLLALPLYLYRYLKNLECNEETEHHGGETNQGYREIFTGFAKQEINF
jgi:hypothetical protein